jgi:hypothetical protein
MPGPLSRNSMTPRAPSTPARNFQPPLAGLFGGIGGVLHQVHRHLLQLAGGAEHLDSLGQVQADLERVGGGLAHPLHRAFDHLDQVEGAPLVAIGGGKALQRIDDVAGALGALHRAVDQRGQVVEHAVDAQLLAQGFALVRGMSPWIAAR